jgi:cytochrome c553
VQASNLRPRRSRTRLINTLIATAAAVFAAPGLMAQEGSPEAGQAKAATCSACHGADGNSTANPLWPSLAGQHAAYTERQLEAYRSGERDAPEMVIAQTVSADDARDIAAYFASQTITPKGADPALVDRGERIYRGGIPERGIAACIACHGPSGKGNPLAGYPRVSHQHAPYLAATLRDYQSGERRSDATLNQMMRNVAELLLDDEIDALASYMQGLE